MLHGKWWWNNPNAKFPFNNRGEVTLGPDGKPIAEAGKKTEAELKADAEALAKKEAEGKPVTQEAINRIYGKLKETEEKLVRSEQEKVGLVGRVADIEKRIPKPAGEAPKPKEYGEDNFPKSEEEWDDLFAENPAKATDLRYAYNNSRRKVTDGQAKSREKLFKDHAEMYKREADGSLSKDTDGYPMLDMTTEKAKIFCEEANKSGLDSDGVPIIFKAINGPEMVMAATVLRLKGGEDAKVKKELEEKKAAEEKKRKGEVGAGGVASGGVGAPPEKKVEVIFNSAPEKEAAEAAVRSGKYKDLEEYCRVRDDSTIGYGRGGF